MFMQTLFFIRKVEMVNFELGDELRKMFFRLVTSVGQRKNSESPWWIEPQTFGFALRCSTTEPQRLDSIPHGDSEFFLCPTRKERNWEKAEIDMQVSGTIACYKSVILSACHSVCPSVVTSSISFARNIKLTPGQRKSSLLTGISCP